MIWNPQLRLALSSSLLVLAFWGCGDQGSPVAEVPLCSLSLSVLEFGDVKLGESATQLVEITNDGAGMLQLDVQSSCADFEIVSGAGVSKLGPGETTSFSVRFAPTEEGESSCEITAGSECGALSASGRGVLDTAAASCELSSTSLDFGQVDVGSSADRQFVIRNTGAVEFSGQVTMSAPDFEFLAGEGSYTLGAGDSLVVSLRFAPTSAGTVSASVNGGVECGAVAIGGEGRAVAVPVSFSGDIQPIFSGSCALSGCHAMPLPKGDLNLSPGVSYSEIVNVVSTTFAPAIRVVPGDPDASVLYHRVAATNVYGTRMPPTAPLPPSEVELIRAWIADGAPDN